MTVHRNLLPGCLHPETLELVTFRLADRYLSIRERGPSSAIADMVTIAEVCQDRTIRRFRGLRRPRKERAYALVGRPSHRYDLSDKGLVEIEKPVNTLFTVFVDEALCIFHHAWIELDHYAPGQSAQNAEDTYARKCFEEELT